MCNQLKSTIDELEYSQKSVALATGISEARLSNLCNMTQSKLDISIKLREFRAIEQFLEGLYLCEGCNSIITDKDTATIKESERGYTYSSENVCAECGSPDYYNLEFVGEDFHAP
jgi:uncharacterized protein with PIN domain